MKTTSFFGVLFLCGLCDALTTGVGLLSGFSETRVLLFSFWAAPFLSTILFWGVSYLVLRWPVMGKKWFFYGLFIVALIPVINNLMVISGVGSLSLFRLG